jgi:hypothetical protein
MNTHFGHAPGEEFAPALARLIWIAPAVRELFGDEARRRRFECVDCDGPVFVRYRPEALVLMAERSQKAAEKKEAALAAETSHRSTAAPYPVEALGEVLGAAADAIAEKVQCAPALAANSVLAVASLAAQAVGDVQLPFGQTRPLSLYILTIGGSGDRKSTADGEAMSPVGMREADLSNEHKERMSAYERQFAAWKAERDRILKDRTASMGAKEAELAKIGEQPMRPRKPMLTFADVTQEGVISAFDTMPPAIGIFSPEGGMFLTGHGFTPEKKTASAGAFANFWDGTPVRRARVGTGVTDLSGRRLSVHVLVQPDIATTFLSDPALRNQGLIARFLMARPESLIGDRPWREIPEWVGRARGDFSLLMERLFRAAKTKDDDGAVLDLRVLTINDAAKSAWTSFHDEVEAGMKPAGRYAGLHDVASKTAEQAVRIAGVLTLFEDPAAKEIDQPIMERACVLARWYLDEAARLMETASIADEIDDGNDIIKWITTRPEDDTGGWTVSLRDIQRGGVSAFGKTRSGGRPLSSR